jgi:hypothetical protein
VDVLDPAAFPRQRGAHLGAHLETGELVEVHRVDDDAAVVARAERNPDRAVDCHRQDEPVDVGVIADQVHATRRAREERRRRAVPLRELPNYARAQFGARGVGRGRRIGSHPQTTS